MIERVPYCGIELARLTAPTFADAIKEAVATDTVLTVSYAHMHTVNLIQDRRDARDAFRGIAAVAPDGIAVLTSTRRMRRPFTRDNIIVMECSMAVIGPEAVRQDWTFFLFGGAEGIAARAAARLEHSYPGLKVVGTHHGMVDARQMSDVVALIAAAKPTILLVGLGQPRQEQWIVEHQHHLAAHVVVGVGGYLEKLARRATVYPPWVNRTKLYWLHRLLTEPHRVWTRYSFGAVKFAWVQLRNWRADASRTR